MTKEIKKYSEKEYENHGDIMYKIGKQDAFRSVLKTEVSWSVKMTDEEIHRAIDNYDNREKVEDI